MYVAELDRPWLETPFLMQGFVIHTQMEISKLGQYCKFVYVEKQGRQWSNKQNPFQSSLSRTKRDSLGRHESPLANNRSRPARRALNYSISDREPYSVSNQAFEEHEQARTVHKYAKQTITSLMEQSRLGGAVDTESAKDVVNQCSASIMRNPHALMWMAKIKHADEYTLEHCLNVSILAIAFGRHLRMTSTDIEKLGLCGLLHDIGKMQIPDEVLNKPGKLTDEEKKIMNSHPVNGRNLLMKSGDTPAYAIDAAFNHHERMDGKGYPRGLTSNEISSFSRVVSIVDAFDAMTSDRCYDRSRSTLEALKEIYKERGKQFDEELALEFIQLIGPYPPGTIVELKNGMVGIAISSEEKKRHLPAVRILLDEHKQNCEHYLVDLLDVEKGELEKTFLIAKVLKDGTYDIRLEDHTDESIRQASTRLAEESAEQAAQESDQAITSKDSIEKSD